MACRILLTMFQLLGSMMHLRLDAATCARMTLRRVLREVVVPRAWRQPGVAGAVGVGSMVEGVLGRMLASLLDTGGRAALMRLDAAGSGCALLRRVPRSRGGAWRAVRRGCWRSAAAAGAAQGGEVAAAAVPRRRTRRGRRSAGAAQARAEAWAERQEVRRWVATCEEMAAAIAREEGGAGEPAAGGGAAPVAAAAEGAADVEAAAGVVAFVAPASAPAAASEGEAACGEEAEEGTDDGSTASSGERAALGRAEAVDVAAEWAEVERARARRGAHGVWVWLGGIAIWLLLEWPRAGTRSLRRDDAAGFRSTTSARTAFGRPSRA